MNRADDVRGHTVVTTRYSMADEVEVLCANVGGNR